MRAKKGAGWAEIAGGLEGRTHNMVKVRWISLVRQHERQQRARDKREEVLFAFNLRVNKIEAAEPPSRQLNEPYPETVARFGASLTASDRQKVTSAMQLAKHKLRTHNTKVRVQAIVNGGVRRKTKTTRLTKKPSK